MGSDDLVIGSGLAALGAVLGLLETPGRRIAVLCGPREGRFLRYGGGTPAPCAWLGPGGMGSHWHGVIPMRLPAGRGAGDAERFAALFGVFYPRAGGAARLGPPALFIPWRPIRPWPALQRLAARHGRARLRLLPATARVIRRHGSGIEVDTDAGTERAARCWVAAGALSTPALLAASFGPRLARGLASDHVVCYLGQIDGAPRPEVGYTRDGMYLPAVPDPADRALYTLRPARFDFRRLDAGFERRQVFGLPTGSLLAKLLGRASPGLIAEALYNRFGLFGGAGRHSAYAQVRVPDAYALADGPEPLAARPAAIRAATDAARAAQPWPTLRASQQPALTLPGIHLHHTLDLAALAGEGLDAPESPVQVVDASALADIGAEHHSFRMLVRAHARAAGGAVR